MLVLYGIRTHERLMEKTRLNFTISLLGQSVDALATLDGNAILSGQRITLGRHEFTITHPKAKSFSTNLFIWYGGCDLGNVVLKRARGNLSVAADPIPVLLKISGPEFSVTRTNLSGFTSSIPTDVYTVQARWENYDETRNVAVRAGHEGVVTYAPQLGDLSLETEPPGAVVTDITGREVGSTPVILKELPFGTWKGELRMNGYVPVPCALPIMVHQTNSFHANLVNWQYAQAIQDATRLYAAHDYERAFEAVETALKANGNDPNAKSLHDTIAVARCLQRGRNFFGQSRYGDAQQESEAALRIEPENDDAKALLAAARKHEEKWISEQKRKDAQALAEQTRRERLENLERTMSSITGEHLDGALFDVHRLTFTNNVKDLGKAIQDALLTKSPIFEVEKYNWSNDYVFVLEAKQPSFGGLTQCLIVGTQTGDNESVVMFRILEYETHLNLNVGGVIKISDGRPPLVALPNRKDRIIEGIQSMILRIKSAIP